jgi:hypothetical protein
MCLHLLNDEVKKTEKPIVVYKKLNYKNGLAKSYHYRFNYVSGILQPKVKLRPVYGDSSIEDGYHSRKKNIDSNAVFVIPKGVDYYEGFENYSTIRNYVSETIIYVGHKLNPLTWFKVIYYKHIRG